MNFRARTVFCLVAVSCLFAFHVHLKTQKIFRNATWDAQDEVGQFWSEFAFHYRFAKFFAEHPVSDWGQLAHDRDVQRPEVINDWAEFTVAMEVPVGALYRWLYGTPLTLTLYPHAERGERSGAVPFHVFVVWYDCIVSSLSLFAVFFLARALWRSDGAGVLAAVFYATLYPSYGRTVKNLFLREDFAIPLILVALVFTVRAMQCGADVSSARDQGKDRRDVCPIFQILAALFCLAALASWHLTQFVMAVLVGAVALVFLMRGEIPRVPWSVAVLAAGGVLIPVLRAKQFYLSPSMCVLYGLTLTAWLDGSRRKQLAVFFGATAVCVLLGAVLQKSYGEYAHVYQLFFYKLRFLGVKPDHPSQLPWEARTLWEGAFNSADWTEPWHSLQWCFPLSLAAVWMTRHNKDASVRVWVVFALLLFLLGAMVLRFFTFVGFAAAVMAAGLWVQRRIWSTLAVPAAIVWQVATLNFQPLDRTPVEPSNYKPVVRWLNENTPTNAVILAHISEAPVFWAHTGRPIILHSKFENLAIRERFREFLDAVYGSEEKFHAFCLKNGTDYFVYDPGFMLLATDSRRYKADKIGDLDENCAVKLFAEHPERLRLFAPEFLEGKFRVFRVLP